MLFYCSLVKNICSHTEPNTVCEVRLVGVYSKQNFTKAKLSEQSYYNHK